MSVQNVKYDMHLVFPEKPLSSVLEVGEKRRRYSLALANHDIWNIYREKQNMEILLLQQQFIVIY